MKKIIPFVLTLFILSTFSSTFAFAGGAAARRRQGGAQQRRVMQQRRMQQEAMQQRVSGQSTSRPIQGEFNIPQSPIFDESEVTIVTLSDIWATFEHTSQAWSQIIDYEAKIETVAHYINIYRKNGIRISKPPSYYAQMIDSMSQNDPNALSPPFSQVLQIVAIIDYDFDNGQDKDALARKVLGEEGFIANKKRLRK